MIRRLDRRDSDAHPAAVDRLYERAQVSEKELLALRHINLRECTLCSRAPARALRMHRRPHHVERRVQHVLESIESLCQKIVACVANDEVSYYQEIIDVTRASRIKRNSGASSDRLLVDAAIATQTLTPPVISKLQSQRRRIVQDQHAQDQALPGRSECGRTRRRV